MNRYGRAVRWIILFLLVPLAHVLLLTGAFLEIVGRWLRPELEPAIPRNTDPEAPMMDPERCARLPGGHDPITRTRKDGRKVRSCPRCGADPRELRDFDARR